jgi:hypothetical protein
VSGAYEGKQIVGIDLHRRRSVLVRMTETGERLETVRISNDPEYLRQAMAHAGERPEVVVNAGPTVTQLFRLNSDPPLGWWLLFSRWS